MSPHDLERWCRPAILWAFWLWCNVAIGVFLLQLAGVI